MYKDVSITARTMTEALSKVKDKYGSDALIVQQQEQDGQVTIIVREQMSSKTHLGKDTSVADSAETPGAHQSERAVSDNAENNQKSPRSQIPVWARPVTRFHHDDIKVAPQSEPTRGVNESSRERDTDSADSTSSSAKFKNEQNIEAPQLDIAVRKTSLDQSLAQSVEGAINSSHDSGCIPQAIDCFAEPMAAIGTLCDVATYHQLGESLSEAWLVGMNGEFSKNSIKLTNGLEPLIDHDALWIRNIASKQRLVLVGPPGAGKTVTLAKIAAHLMARGKIVKVVTLDVVKSMGSKQLEAYLSPLGVNIEIGIKAVTQKIDNEIMLIDTAGLNIYNPNDYKYLNTFYQKMKIPFVLVLPGDINPAEVEEVCHLYRNVGARYVIFTKLDLTKRYGAVLRSARQGLQLIMLSNSPNLSEKLVVPKIETLVHNMIKACEVK